MVDKANMIATLKHVRRTANHRIWCVQSENPKTPNVFHRVMFDDDGLMSNSPVTQLILLHRSYWFKARGIKDKVPTLGVCVINVHLTRQKEIPTDHDGVVNRNNGRLNKDIVEGRFDISEIIRSGII